MPNTKIKSPTLIGGISQQPPHLRFASQVETAVNVMFDVATGASKRPGSELVAVPGSLAVGGDYQIYAIERGDGEGYIVIIGDGGSGASILRVFQDDGREATVNITANAQTYLDANAPSGKDFRFASNQDLVVIVNRKADAAAPSGVPTATTMPIKLTRTTAPTPSSVAVFACDVNTWTSRASGTDSNNAGFGAIVSGDGLFTDATFYRNRLVLAGGEYLAFSQAGTYFNYYIQDVTSVVDDDPLETRLASTIESVQTFRKALSIFTRSGTQYESNAPDLLTPATLNIAPTTRYETHDVKPIVLGSAMYFMGDKSDGSILYEYLYDDTQLATVAADVSRHVDTLLPDEVRSISGSAESTTVIVLGNNQPENAFLLLETGDRLLLESGDSILLDQAPVGSNEIYVYRYYWSGDQKQQSAWAIWRFDDDDRIADIAVLNNCCYMLTHVYSSINVSEALVLERIPLNTQRTADSGMPYPVHLDRWEKLVGGYFSPGTTWTSSSDALIPSKVVLGPDFADAGSTVAITNWVNNDFYAEGEYDAGEVYAGAEFQYTLTPTRLYRRDRNGNADVLGELAISKIGVHHFETCEYDLTVSDTNPRRADRTKSFAASKPSSGTTEVYYGGDSDDLNITVESFSPKPTTVSAYEVEASYHPRA